MSELSPHAATTTTGLLPGRELFWRDRYDWLKSVGYVLRPRYKPDWIPSWTTSNIPSFRSEDNVAMKNHKILDAVRVSDGTTVILKRISKVVHSNESSIGVYLSSTTLASDPHNHCCPILDVLEDPFDSKLEYIVMPLLRSFYDPKLETVGEAVEFFRQTFEGLQFMHQHRIAHRDISHLNIMMDSRPILPSSFHPQAPWDTPDTKQFVSPRSRTKYPVNYLITDFGLSQRYDASDSNPLALPILGGDKTVPEFQEDRRTPRNPFHTDVYYMGNLVRTSFLDKYRNLRFMDALITRMVQPEPDKRSSMDEVVTCYDQIMTRLSSCRLRQRLVDREDGVFVNVIKGAYHFSSKTIPHILARRPPLPTPKSK